MESAAHSQQPCTSEVHGKYLASTCDALGAGRAPEQSVKASCPEGAAATAGEQTFWLVRLHNRMISHHPYKTEADG